MRQAGLDEVGYWTEVKLDIVREYAAAYSRILNAQSNIRSHLYIDAFAGAGVHISRTSGRFIPGSPLNALEVDPPFREYHLIDWHGGKAGTLRALAGDRPNVFVHEGDANHFLPQLVFPRCRYEDYHRGLCLLDPYGLHLNWNVIQSAGEMRSIEIFLNFPVMDMNMNVLWRRPEEADPRQVARMHAYWGDDSWRNAAYRKTRTLFGDVDEKTTTRAVVAAFRTRLREVAGFDYVPEPMPMRNSRGATVYYLFFASPNRTGEKIVKDIFQKYRRKGMP